MVEKQIKYDLSDKETAWLVATMLVSITPMHSLHTLTTCTN